MADKGLMYVCAGKFNEAQNGTITYTEGLYFGPSSTLTGSVNKTDASDYGDSRLVEKSSEVTSVSLSWELNENRDDIYVYLMGHTKADDGTITFSGNDSAPFVGLGVIGESEVSDATNASNKYLAIFYKKCQFSEPDTSHTTKTDTVSFGHTTLSGSAFLLGDGTYKETKRFSTLATAETWIHGKCGLSE